MKTASIAALVGLLASGCVAPEPRNPAAALLEKADELRTQGDLEAAIPAYEEAIAADPESVPAYLGLAIAHSNLGNTAEAERFYLVADAKGPEDIQVKLNLAGFYYRNRNYDRALWALQKAMDIAPEGDEASLISSLWTRVEAAQVRARVRQNLLDTLAESPDDEEAASRLADSYAREAEDLLQGGNTRETLALVQEAMETVPEAHRAELYYVGAQAHSALGDQTTAVEWLDKALGLDDEVPTYHLSRAGFLMDDRKFDEADAELDRVIELAPGSEEAEFARIRKEDIERIKQIPEDRLEEYLNERRAKTPAKKKDSGG